jgi:hypothetical protein
VKDQHKVNATLVDALGSALRSGDHGLKTVPGLLKRVLSEESWREFTTQRGELVQHERFEEFVVRAPLKGLGASVELVRRVVADDPEAVDLLDRALQGRQGQRTDLVDNIHKVERPAGTSQTAALRRLRKDAPELHAEVLAGNLSAHAAMVQAGFRRRTISVPADEPEHLVQSLRRNLSPEHWAEVQRLVAESA